MKTQKSVDLIIFAQYNLYFHMLQLIKSFWMIFSIILQSIGKKTKKKWCQSTDFSK